MKISDSYQLLIVFAMTTLYGFSRLVGIGLFFGEKAELSLFV